MDEERKLTVEESDNDSRIDKLLAEKTSLSRNHIQKLSEEGFLSVNGKKVKNNYKCRTGDVITLLIPETAETEIKAENIPIDVVYEDDDIIIVNKARGMVVHPAPGHSEGTLVNSLMYHAGDSLSGINGENRPGIVHRIDKDTSGVLVICKNDASHRHISELLSTHSITRKYYCIVQGHFKSESGTVDMPIGRHPVDRKKMAANVKNGRNAVTHYRVLFQFGRNYSLLECTLETGRTHQIRVHMSAISHPLLGDFVYGREKQDYCSDGQVLHAAVLGFTHPKTGEYVEFSAPVPEYFGNLCKKLCIDNNEYESLKKSLSGFPDIFRFENDNKEVNS